MVVALVRPGFGVPVDFLIFYSPSEDPSTLVLLSQVFLLVRLSGDRSFGDHDAYESYSHHEHKCGVF